MEKDQILDLQENPGKNFAPTEEVDIDFSRVSLAVLLRSKNWLTKDAIEYLEVDLDHEVDGPPMTRREIAQLLIDTRDRKIALPNEV